MGNIFKPASHDSLCEVILGLDLGTARVLHPCCWFMRSYVKSRTQLEPSLLRHDAVVIAERIELIKIKVPAG
jgi:hypothetical protein